MYYIFYIFKRINSMEDKNYLDTISLEYLKFKQEKKISKISEDYL
jgi:hypothetical protein